MDSLHTANINTILQNAFKKHQKGMLQNALDDYLQVIKLSPSNPDAYHLAGLVFLQTNQISSAIEYIKKATDFSPKHADAWNNLGISYFNNSNYDDAIKAYKRCIKINKKNYQAHNNLGNVYRELGKFEKSINHFKEAIRLAPLYAEAYNNLGNVFKDTNNKKEAIRYYKKAIKTNPSYFDALKNMGITFSASGEYLESVRYYQEAIKIIPDNPDIMNLCARSYVGLEDYENALIWIDKALSNNQLSSEYLNTRGKILIGLDRTQEAIDSLEKGRSIDRYNKTILLNLSFAYKKVNDFQNAEKVLRQLLEFDRTDFVAINDLAALKRLDNKPLAALKIFEEFGIADQQKTIPQPILSRLYTTLGLSFLDIKDLKNARQAFLNAVDIGHKNTEANLSLAFIDLLEGDIKSWWDGYEKRKSSSDPNGRYGLLPELNEWDGDAQSEDKTLVVLPEQGIGDEIMFATLIPELRNFYKGKIILACDPRLVDIYKRTFQGVEVSRLNGLSLKSNYQKIYIGSLGRYFRRSKDEFIPRLKYLYPLEDRVQYFMKKYEHLSGLKIGISWRSGNSSEGKKRTLELDNWKDILKIIGCNVFNLQYGDVDDQIKSFYSKTGIEIINDNEVDPLKDIENFAALISTLDLIITIDNSTIHFGGALGIPAWLMLPYLPDWRWCFSTNRSIWYENMELYKQDSYGSWDNIIIQIKENLITLRTERR